MENIGLWTFNKIQGEEYYISSVSKSKCPLSRWWLFMNKQAYVDSSIYNIGIFRPAQKLSRKLWLYNQSVSFICVYILIELLKD